MKILILSFYYAPDLCAGSFRCTALVELLKRVADPSIEIEVLTTLPNRYASFNASAPEVEQQPRVSIRRIALPPHCSGMIDQAKAFAHFAKEVHRFAKNKHYDLVFATSSRLMTAALGAWIARRKRAVLYLDIRDMFVDTLKDVLPSAAAVCVKPIFSCLEKWAFTQAQRINLVSNGFQEEIQTRYPRAQLRFFTNGIDAEFMMPQMQTHRAVSANGITILYAGNMGEGQGLHWIIPELAKRLEGRARFILMGDGGRKKQLEDALRAAQCHNVELLPPVCREQLIKAYQQADVLFLHLNDYDAFHKVLPSKIFEYAATGKPILAGVAGYPAEFINTEIPNAAVFPPCNGVAAETAFQTLRLEAQQRNLFVRKYARDHIMRAMANDILSLL